MQAKTVTVEGINQNYSWTSFPPRLVELNFDHGKRQLELR
jgi:hypothetical protein